MTILRCLLAAALATSAFARAEPADEPQIRRAALDYIEGWYTGDAPRMDRALDGDLVKRKVTRVSRDGKTTTETSGKDELVQAAEAGWGKRTPPDKRLQSVRVLDVNQDMASVRVETGEFVDYLHLARDGAGWKILNVMWQPKLD